MTEFILIPMSWHVSKSFAAARMARPIFVLLISICKTTTRATTRKGVTIVTHLVLVPYIMTDSLRNGIAG